MSLSLALYCAHSLSQSTNSWLAQSLKINHSPNHSIIFTLIHLLYNTDPLHSLYHTFIHLLTLFFHFYFFPQSLIFHSPSPKPIFRSLAALLTFSHTIPLSLSYAFPYIPEFPKKMLRLRWKFSGQLPSYFLRISRFIELFFILPWQKVICDISFLIFKNLLKYFRRI
jgi:hypothetical protein